MRIIDALKSISMLYIETAPFIYYTESHTGYVQKMRVFFTAVGQGNIQVITGAVTLVETLMKPLERNDQALVYNSNIPHHS